MRLGEVQGLSVQFARLQPFIDVAGEGEGGLDAAGRFGLESLEPFDVQGRQIVGNPHQPAQIGLGLAPGGLGQAVGVFQKAAVGAGQGRVGRGEVQSLGGGKNDQQDKAP